jgi:uncharacterized protein
LAGPAGAAPTVSARPERYATDLAGVIDAGRLQALNERLAQFERDTSNQVLVFVDRRIPAGTTLEEYANAAFVAWKVGQKDKDNGVVFFAFIDDRKMRIEVGYGLEPSIPDARAKQIIDLVVTPRFKQGDLTGGVEQAADELMKAARGEAFQGTGQTVAEAPPMGPLPSWLWVIPFLGLGVGLLASRRAKTLPSTFAIGGGGFAISTAVMAMASTFFTHDGRPMAMGFGLLLVGLAVMVVVLIGQGAGSLGTRQRFGLGLLQAGAGLLIGAFGLIALSVGGLQFFAQLAGFAILLGVPALPLGGLLRSDDPLKVLTLFFGRVSFAVFILSGLALALVLFIHDPGIVNVLDFFVVSGLIWLACWVYAHQQGFKLAPKVEVSEYRGSRYSGSSGGGWSSSSSYSSSSSSSSSYSGGGGSSGGGGASGGW